MRRVFMLQADRGAGGRRFPLAPLVLAFLLISGCSGDAGYKPVDFSQTVEIEHPVTSTAAPPEIRVAVAAMISPKETLSYYQQLLEFIGENLGVSIQLIQRKTYGEVNELFPKRQIDLAFICTGPYALGKEIFGFEALATPIVRDRPYYQSYLIVNKSSSFESLEDLRGQQFAFTDPESNTGALVPNYWLAEIGETANSFFESVTYTYSHDNSIMAVAKSLVDGAAVDGHKWEYYNQRNPYYTSMTRVIKRSAPFGSPPLVASVYLSETLKEKIQHLLLSMHEQTEGKRILDELMIDRFAKPDDRWYQPVRDMYEKVRFTVTRESYATQDP